MKLTDTVSSDSIAIIGMCKNAGKTTALNSLIASMDEGICLALTSIGRDGETADTAHATPKPDIYVREGTVFATAADMIKNCDVTTEILDTCGIFTPLGEVVIARARSDGNIDIAGPSTIEGLKKVHKLLKYYGGELTIFDGAISRKSLSVPTLCEEFILCTGASYSQSMQTTVNDTEYYVRLFMSETEKEQDGCSDSKITVFADDTAFCFENISDAVTLIKKARKITSIRIRGAVTDSILKPIIGSGLRDAVILSDDPSKLMQEQKTYESCIARNLVLKVVHKSRLCAVTVNPYSVFGAPYDKDEFFDRMSNALEKYNIPVFDVKR